MSSIEIQPSSRAHASAKDETTAEESPMETILDCLEKKGPGSHFFLGEYVAFLSCDDLKLPVWIGQTRESVPTTADLIPVKWMKITRKARAGRIELNIDQTAADDDIARAACLGSIHRLLEFVRFKGIMDTDLWDELCNHASKMKSELRDRPVGVQTLPSLGDVSGGSEKEDTLAQLRKTSIDTEAQLANLKSNFDAMRPTWTKYDGVMREVPSDIRAAIQRICEVVAMRLVRKSPQPHLVSFGVHIMYHHLQVVLCFETGKGVGLSQKLYPEVSSDYPVMIHSACSARLEEILKPTSRRSFRDADLTRATESFQELVAEFGDCEEIPEGMNFQAHLLMTKHARPEAKNTGLLITHEIPQTRVTEVGRIRSFERSTPQVDADWLLLSSPLSPDKFGHRTARDMFLMSCCPIVFPNTNDNGVCVVYDDVALQKCLNNSDTEGVTRSLLEAIWTLFDELTNITVSAIPKRSERPRAKRRKIDKAGGDAYQRAPPSAPAPTDADDEPVMTGIVDYNSFEMKERFRLEEDEEHFKEQLMRDGFIRVLEYKPDELELGWNDYKPKSGDLIRASVEHTTLSGPDKIFSCTCKHFLLSGRGGSLGKCLHTEVAQLVKQCLDAKEDDRIHTDFTRWVCVSQSNAIAAGVHGRVVRLNSLTHYTADYAVFLTPKEADENGCQIIGRVTASTDQNQVTIKCSNGACRKRRAKSGPCSHARILTSALGMNEHELSEDEQDGDDTVGQHDTAEHEPLEVSSGVMFDTDRGIYVPAPDCLYSPIPENQSEDSLYWFRRRTTLADIARTEDGSPVLDDRGCYIGPLCVAKKCWNCGCNLDSDGRSQEMGTLIVHTQNGPIARKKLRLQCAECHSLNDWNPATEFIHTIRNQAEGGGYELIYRFLSHVFGKKGEFAGVPMFMGHFNKHMGYNVPYTTRFASFSQDNWRRFLQSGVSLWMQNLQNNMPCCDCRWVGGDGTCIGIPVRNLGALKPVWQPDEVLPQSGFFGRIKRVALVVADLEGHSKANLRRVMRSLLTSTTSDRAYTSNFELYMRCSDAFPDVFNDIFQRYNNLEPGRFQIAVRNILRSSISEHSVTTLIPKALIPPLKAACEALMREGKGGVFGATHRLKSACPFLDWGILPDIAEAIQAGADREDDSLSLLCKLLLHIVERAKTLWDELDGYQEPDQTLNQNDPVPVNPPQDGFRSFITADGRSVRNKWPLPSTAKRKAAQTEVSCEGCQKLTYTTISKNARSGLWITFCMIHQTVIEFHVIKDGEGRRDCLLPLYRFMENPPEVVFCDTACHCEESSLNWVPHFFKNTAWYHDIFHGYAHICPNVFSSSRTRKYKWVDTSLMEQANSFFQNLKGLLRGGKTKRSTLMFWMEVFARVWNTRKLDVE